MSQTYRNTHRKSRPTTIAMGAVIATAALFFVLPFFQLIGKLQNDLTRLERLDVSLPPPPPPPTEPPPPPEPEQEQDAPELDQTPPPLTLSQLELALEPGTGGAMGDFSIAGFQANISALDEIRIFELSELDRIPRPIFQVAPVYPYELRQAGVSGQARIMFIVDENGNVRSPRVDSSTHREFEQPSLDAIVQWRFEPGMKDGKAVRTRMLLPLAFNVRR